MLELPLMFRVGVLGGEGGGGAISDLYAAQV